MDLASWRDLFELVANLVTAIALAVGGVWVLFKYGLYREAHSKIEFDLELELAGKQDSDLVIEIVAKVSNKGLVRHRLQNFRFDLLYLPKDAKVVRGGSDINDQVEFFPLIKKQSWIPERDWKYTFIDPGVDQRYSYITSAPSTAAFLLVFARFHYPDSKSDFHTAQKVFGVEKLMKDCAPMAKLHSKQ